MHLQFTAGSGLPSLRVKSKRSALKQVKNQMQNYIQLYLCSQLRGLVVSAFACEAW